MKNRKPVKVKVGMRVCDEPTGQRWGTVTVVKDRRKEAKTASQKILAKRMSHPLLCTIAWDSGRVTTGSSKHLWFEGDDPGFGRKVLVDPNPVVKHDNDCHLGDNYKDCPACKESADT